MKYLYQPINECKHSISPFYRVAAIRHIYITVELVQTLGTEKNKEKRRKEKRREEKREASRGERRKGRR